MSSQLIAANKILYQVCYILTDHNQQFYKYFRRTNLGPILNMVCEYIDKAMYCVLWLYGTKLCGG